MDAEERSSSFLGRKTALVGLEAMTTVEEGAPGGCRVGSEGEPAPCKSCSGTEEPHPISTMSKAGQGRVQKGK